MTTSEAFDSSVVASDEYSVVVAAIVQVQPKDFMVVRQEWATIRQECV